MRLCLASRSPRRQEILKGAGIPFVVCPADIDEAGALTSILSDTRIAGPGPVAAELSRQKAMSAAQRKGGTDTLILAADTMVAFDETLLGKPADSKQAYEMLCALSGREHSVYTGYTLTDGTKTHTAFERTRVFFRSLSDRELQAYIASGQPFDKAGGYGIQEGWAMTFTERIEGDFYNVMGLPLCAIVQSARDWFGAEW